MNAEEEERFNTAIGDAKFGAAMDPGLCRTCWKPRDEAHPGYGDGLTIIGSNQTRACDVPDNDLVFGSYHVDGTQPSTGTIRISDQRCDKCGHVFELTALPDVVAHMVEHAL